jgi:hypothetical protein
MIAKLLFILYKQEDHIIPKHYYKILRLIFCLSYFIAIIILSKTVSNSNDIHFNLTQIIILFLTTIVIPADLLDHTGREEDILLQNLEYTFISKLSQPRIIYDASKNLDFITFHDIASSESVYTMISYKLEEIQKTQMFKVLKWNKKYNQSDTYYMGQNHIDDESKNQYEIERIEVYDAKVKTTVFKRKAIKTVKMIDFYWKGKDK